MPEKRLNRSLLLLALVGLFLTGAGCGGRNSENPALRYVALGDSIAFGPIATERSGYVYEFRAYLEAATSASVSLNNQAVPLIKTGDLLNALEDDTPPGIRGAVENAQVLTISIGGNNLLDCASDNYNNLDTACMDSGVTSFGEDWPRILAEIRNIGSQAKLYVSTVYNPYRGDDPNYAAADTRLRQINAILSDPAHQSIYNYEVADVYTHFQGQFSDGAWKTCTWTGMCEETRDVHPTQSGHQEIAGLYQALYP